MGYPRTVKGPCKAEGCDKISVVKGFCKNHYERLPEHKRALYNAHIKRCYGIDHAVYDFMGETQEWKCAICGGRSSKGGKEVRLAVDHAHESRKVSGLLCYRCNRAIGLFNDDPELLVNAATYLEMAEFTAGAN